MKAVFNNTVIAESDKTIVVEGNHYFPPESVFKEYLQDSEHTSTCPWKGSAHYYHVVVDKEQSDNAAWYYPEPKSEAAEIQNHVAFWKDVEVIS